jgi:hypothetical protein
LNASTWKDKTEIVGIIAILATLVLLIVEIGSNTEATRAQVRQSTADGVRQSSFFIASDQKLRDLIFIEDSLEPLSHSDRNAIGAWTYAYLMTVEEAYLQWANGFLSEELWLNRMNHALWLLQQRRVREIWNGWKDKGYLTDEFVAVMNAELDARQ